MSRFLAAMLCLIVFNRTVNASDPTPEQELAFTKQMENCTLTGSFTVDESRISEPPKPERYEIESAIRTSGNLWVFTVRIKYGQLDTKLPVTVPVEWAGDTPVVTLTNASIPGLGEGFSARVLFYEDRYAGTWQHGQVGGHMFGKIGKSDSKESSEKNDSSKK